MSCKQNAGSNDPLALTDSANACGSMHYATIDGTNKSADREEEEHKRSGGESEKTSPMSIRRSFVS